MLEENSQEGKLGKSKAQDSLEGRLRELYPDAYITSEDYIGDIIEERDYSIAEIRRELGHKPHKMFVDIVMRDSDRTVAFEYHGEQHYALVGNMTKTTAELLLNQQLDQEKSWILSRIGVPLVAVPFDMYLDGRVIEELIDEAFAACQSHRSELSECSSCQRLFPHSEMPYGICRRCRESEESAVAEGPEPDSDGPSHLIRDDDQIGHWDDPDQSYEDMRKAEAKRLRKERYREYKNSPEYQRKKEEDKKRRKELYRQKKAEMKRKKEEGL